ncbi:hypothetical protein HanHA300_Chr00c0303g0741841 [Helianthus annuus]|nr:hypothetical protein HanHA89_Chr15g0631591 [Helianthus annuus]KAJ0630360.1 hypothetical protein HanHA300_Chr00c0303g0741841 [Helianthus annuus]KAJ0650160.1 hypothetical protein HanLR1_Chr15g0592511 [Helianthus annuus]KAJ0653932.1 hypothetical protein HanOQP8_Chr15g0589161 [Helianthus annuus]
MKNPYHLMLMNMCIGIMSRWMEAWKANGSKGGEETNTNTDT